MSSTRSRHTTSTTSIKSELRSRVLRSVGDRPDTQYHRRQPEHLDDASFPRRAGGSRQRLRPDDDAAADLSAEPAAFHPGRELRGHARPGVDLDPGDLVRVYPGVDGIAAEVPHVDAIDVHAGRAPFVEGAAHLDLRIAIRRTLYAKSRHHPEQVGRDGRPPPRDVLGREIRANAAAPALVEVTDVPLPYARLGHRHGIEHRLRGGERGTDGRRTRHYI